MSKKTNKIKKINKIKKTNSNANQKITADSISQLKSIEDQERHFGTYPYSKKSDLSKIIKSLSKNIPSRLSTDDFEIKVDHRMKSLLFSLPQQFLIEIPTNFKLDPNATSISILSTQNASHSILIVRSLENIKCYKTTHNKKNHANSRLCENKNTKQIHIKDYIYDYYLDHLIEIDNCLYLAKVDPINQSCAVYSEIDNFSCQHFDTVLDMFIAIPGIEGKAHLDWDMINQAQVQLPVILEHYRAKDIKKSDLVFIGSYLNKNIYRFNEILFCCDASTNRIDWEFVFDMKLHSTLSGKYVVSIREEYVYIVSIETGKLVIKDELEDSDSWVYHPAVSSLGLNYAVDCNSNLWHFGFIDEATEIKLESHDSYKRDLLKMFSGPLLKMFSDSSNCTGFYSEIQFNATSGHLRDIKGTNDGFVLASTIGSQFIFLHKTENLAFQVLGQLAAILSVRELEYFIDFETKCVDIEYLTLALLRSKNYFHLKKNSPFHSSITLIHKPTLAGNHTGVSSFFYSYNMLLNEIYKRLNEVIDGLGFDELMFGSESLIYMNKDIFLKFIDLAKQRLKNSNTMDVLNKIELLDFTEHDLCNELDLLLKEVVYLEGNSEDVFTLLYILSFIKNNEKIYKYKLHLSLPS